MPVYRCFIPDGSVPLDIRPKIAKAFTDVHCGITGAPRSFVHVMFFETPRGVPDHETPYFIDGLNRAGRPPEVKKQILDSLISKFSEVANVPPREVGGTIAEMPASHFMEEGIILPEPGEEGAEWFAAGSAKR